MDDEVVRCLQCDWPLRRGEGFTTVIDPTGPVGVAHLLICVYDLVAGEPRAATQKRRAGLMRMN